MTTLQFPQHAPIGHFAVRDNCLCIGPATVTDLVADAGQTPLYVYDRQVIERQVATLRELLPDSIGINYAVKANPMPAVVRHIAGLVDGLDIASAGELKLLAETGADLTHVSFAGPGKRDEELEAALTAGIVVNLESERELDILVARGREHGIRPRVAVRVNPPFQLRSSGMKMGGGPQQFGIDSEQVPALLARMKTTAVEFVGFHIFTGSQNLRADAICEAQRHTCQLAARLAPDAPAPVQTLNIGGGFGVPYFPGDQPLDLAAIAANLKQLLPGVARAMPGARLILELGRYLVAEAGVYLCRVIDRKTSRGEVFLITDGGLHHHLAASGNFGQVIRKNYPVAVANRIAADRLETVSVVGPLCTPLDLLADRVPLPVAGPSDLIAVFHSGAYGRSASPLGFLSHPPPLEVLV